MGQRWPKYWGNSPTKLLLWLGKGKEDEGEEKEKPREELASKPFLKMKKGEFFFKKLLEYE